MAGKAATGLTESFRSLSSANFRLLALGNFLYMGGYNMDLVARAWLSYAISGSALTMGQVALGQGIGQIVACIFSGTAADRLNKRKLLAVVHLSMSLIALSTALLVQFGLIQLWQLAVQGLLIGLIFPFSLPARQAYLPELVPKDEIAGAVAIDSGGKNLSRIIGPGIEGVLLAWDPTLAFYAIAALQFSSVLTILRLPPSPARKTAGSNALSDVLGGFQYAWKDPMMRMLLAMALFTSLLGMPYLNLLPVFQSAVLHVSEAQLGLMYAVAGIGALLGSFVITVISWRGRLELMQALAGVALGVVVALFALSPHFALSVFVLFWLGLVSFGYITLNNMVILLGARSDMRGRMMSLYVLTHGLVPMALVPLGASIDVFGAPVTMAVAGGLLALAMIALMLRFPAELRGRSC